MEENNRPRVGAEEVRRARELLRRYKDGKASLERRVVEDEKWWSLRHWEVLRRKGVGRAAAENGGCGCGENPAFGGAEPASAWLFNAIVAKHADAMDNYPEPVVLPREESDRRSAELLTQVLPVVLENADFEQTWSDNWWEKLKHGTAAYGVFWNSEKDGGLGDVEVRKIDLLNLFWEPGVTDIQRSRNLFVTELADDELLLRRWPDLEGKLGTAAAGTELSRYVYDESVDVSGKSVVVDWYYKVRCEDGLTRLHYAKFVGEELLYASENDPACADTGFYAHGEYPVVLDTLFPEKGTPVGFGYVAVCKDPQQYIDRLFGSILDYAMRAANPRYFMATSTGVNEREFLDWSKPVVHVEGTLDDTRIRRLALEPLSGIYTGILQMKIDEMKDTASNRDVNSGGTERGVTAASAIAALQEAGNKVSRDMIAASYRANVRIARLALELVRQFYDETRVFRVTAPNGETAFAALSGAALRQRAVGSDSLGGPLWRRPVFDLKVRVRKKNPFSVLEQNERAKELYGLRFFDPERAQEALGALEMMDFEGLEAVKTRVRDGRTLYDLALEQAETIRALRAELAAERAPVGVGPLADPQDTGRAEEKRADEGVRPYRSGADHPAAKAVEAHRPREDYARRLAKRT